AISLDPAHTPSYYEYGLIKLYQREYFAAADAFRRFLDNREFHACRDYAALLLYLTRCFQGMKQLGISELFDAFTVIKHPTNWPMPVIRFYRGEISLEVLSRDSGYHSLPLQSFLEHQLAEYCFFVGYYYLTERQEQRAKPYLEKACLLVPS